MMPDANITYGLLPTEAQLFMTQNDYAFTMGMLGIACAVMFWLGFNNHT